MSLPFLLKTILLAGLLAGLQPATASDRRSAGPTPAPAPTQTCRVRLLHFYDDSNNHSDVLNALNNATAAVNADSNLLSSCTLQIIHTSYTDANKVCLCPRSLNLDLCCCLMYAHTRLSWCALSLAHHRIIAFQRLIAHPAIHLQEPNKRVMVESLLEALPMALDGGGYQWPSIPSCIAPSCYSITAGT